MEKPQRTQRQNQMDKIRGLTGMAMGVVYIFVGILVIVANKKGLLQLGNFVSYAVGALCVFYGIFRIWRGWHIRKNALRPDHSTR